MCVSSIFNILFYVRTIEKFFIDICLLFSLCQVEKFNLISKLKITANNLQFAVTLYTIQYLMYLNKKKS